MSDHFTDGLPHQVTLYIPSTFDVDKPLNADAADWWVRNALTFLADLFGGATAQAATGAW
ncbi:MAG: hypothetical protein M5R40_26060 [Anaerolineae bacterium]|nr:hypothetical protein [Anaerolineae bacterium]